MSVVTYNDVCLPFPFITRFDQTPVYDDMGETDWYCTKIELVCQCVVSADYFTQLLPNGAAVLAVTRNPAEVMKIARARLLQPRKTLSVTFNGVELIPAQQGEGPSLSTNLAGLTGTVDVMNGPKPQSCTVTELTNTTFFLTFHIVGHYWENFVGEGTIPRNQIGNGVLFNRWTESVELDASNYSTRSRNGKFKIRSDNFQGFIADMYRRQMATIGVPKGFLRQSSRYTVSPDGLAIEYAVVDKEVYKMPPVFGIATPFEAEGEYVESTGRGGAKRYGDVRVWLRGSKDVDQAALISLAMGLAGKKMSISEGVVGPILNVEGGAVVENCAVRVPLFKNEVEVQLRVMFANSKKRIKGLNLLRATTAFTPFTDGPLLNNPPPNYDVRGSKQAELMVRAAAYYDPNLVGNQLNSTTNQMNQGKEVGTTGRAP